MEQLDCNPCLPLNATYLHTNVGFFPSPKTRGTIDLVQNCVLTILLCTWSIQTNRLQDAWESWLSYFFRVKLSLFLLTLLVPELLSAIAVIQYIRSRIEVASFHEAGYYWWTTTQQKQRLRAKARRGAGLDNYAQLQYDVSRVWQIRRDLDWSRLGALGFTVGSFFVSTATSFIGLNRYPARVLRDLEATEAECRRFKRILSVGYCTLIAIYVVARLYVIVEGFLSLRSVPVGVFYIPNWSRYIPHF